MAKKITSYFRSPLFFVWILTGICLSVSVFFLSNLFFPKNQPNALAFSEDIISACKVSKNKAACYDKELVDLAKKNPMEQVFALNRIIQQKDQSYGYCHTMAHKIVAEEIKKNPGDWKSIFARCPTDQCANGCIHGAFQEKFGQEFLSDQEIAAKFTEIKTICNNNYSLSQNGALSCYHALGHLFFYITSGNIQKSLALCQKAVEGETRKPMLNPCNEGIFMQIYQPTEIEDKTLVKNLQPHTQEDVIKFCSQFKGEAYKACWNQSWPFFWDQLQQAQGLLDLCNLSGIKEINSCYGSILTIIAVRIQGIENLTNYCEDLGSLSKSDLLENKCFSQTASRLIEVDSLNLDKSIAICQQAPLRFQSSCFQDILNSAKDSNYSYNDQCSLFPSTWKEKCLNKI